MRLSEIPLAPDVEQILNAVKIEEESVAATAGEECVVPALTMLGFTPKETSASATIFIPTASTERDSAPLARSTLKVCLPFCGFETRS